jgi:hypothetical protein
VAAQLVASRVVLSSTELVHVVWTCSTIQWVRKLLSRWGEEGIEWRVCEDDHSHPAAAKAKKTRIYMSMPP